jgi:hypothetical protein
VEDAEALVEGVASGGANNMVRQKGASLAKVHLRMRQQMLSPAGGSASTSGQTLNLGSGGGSALPSAILEAFQAIGHTMSCAAELR